jgi:hypothetical protein
VLAAQPEKAVVRHECWTWELLHVLFSHIPGERVVEPGPGRALRPADIGATAGDPLEPDGDAEPGGGRADAGWAPPGEGAPAEEGDAGGNEEDLEGAGEGEPRGRPGEGGLAGGGGGGASPQDMDGDAAWDRPRQKGGVKVRAERAGEGDAAGAAADDAGEIGGEGPGEDGDRPRRGGAARLAALRRRGLLSRWLQDRARGEAEAALGREGEPAARVAHLLAAHQLGAAAAAAAAAGDVRLAGLICQARRPAARPARMTGGGLRLYGAKPGAAVHAVHPPAAHVPPGAAGAVEVSLCLHAVYAQYAIMSCHPHHPTLQPTPAHVSRCVHASAHARAPHPTPCMGGPREPRCARRRRPAAARALTWPRSCASGTRQARRRPWRRRGCWPGGCWRATRTRPRARWAWTGAARWACTSGAALRRGPCLTTEVPRLQSAARRWSLNKGLAGHRRRERVSCTGPCAAAGTRAARGRACGDIAEGDRGRFRVRPGLSGLACAQVPARAERAARGRAGELRAGGRARRGAAARAALPRARARAAGGARVAAGRQRRRLQPAQVPGTLLQAAICKVGARPGAHYVYRLFGCAFCFIEAQRVQLWWKRCLRKKK